MSIRDNLTEARKRCGMTIADAEAETGLPVGEFEAGRDPKASQLSVLADKYHQSMSAMLGGLPDKCRLLWCKKTPGLH